MEAESLVIGFWIGWFALAIPLCLYDLYMNKKKQVCAWCKNKLLR